MTTDSHDRAEDARLDAEAARIAARASKVEAMSDTDPKKAAELRLLNELRYDQSAALMMRSMQRPGPQD